MPQNDCSSSYLPFQDDRQFLNRIGVSTCRSPFLQCQLLLSSSSPCRPVPRLLLHQPAGKKPFWHRPFPWSSLLSLPVISASFGLAESLGSLGPPLWMPRYPFHQEILLFDTNPSRQRGSIKARPSRAILWPWFGVTGLFLGCNGRYIWLPLWGTTDI